MIKISVKLFAAIRDIAGRDELEMVLVEGSTTKMTMEKLIQQYPRLSEWTSHVRLAVNCEYVDKEKQLRDGDEVAIIPPVSGG